MSDQEPEPDDVEEEEEEDYEEEIDGTMHKSSFVIRYCTYELTAYYICSL
jgi:hypothetical protein